MPQDKSEGLKAFKTLVPYIKRYTASLSLGLLALIIVDLAQLVIPQLIRRAINGMAQRQFGVSYLIKFGVLIILLAIGIAVFRYFWRRWIGGTAMKIEELLRNRFLSHLQTLSFNFFNRHKVGDLMAHATNDMLAVRRAMMPGIVILADIIIMGILALVFMIGISPYLTLLAAAPLPILAIITAKFSSLIHNRFERVQDAFSDLTAKVSENLSGIRVIKSYTQEKGEVEHFKMASIDYVKKNISLIKIWGFFWPLIMLFSNFSMFIVLLLGGYRVILSQITIGDFVAFQAYLWMLIWPMIAVGWVINLLQRGAASMGRINRLLKEKPEIETSPAAVYLKEIRGEIDFKSLFFSYNGRKILKDISLKVYKGKVLGIIGSVGCGKSTLVSLIPRLYDPPEGTLFIDGVDIRNVSLDSLRGSIGFVPQDTFLFSTSIKENISFGKDGIDFSKIEEATRIAGIYEEIKEFPQGFDTITGERGITLSGGQKQRIAIARAILIDPKILILDDALSSVDVDTEVEILKNLKEFMEKRSVIIISQRPKSISFADEILVLEDGKIKERGNHKDLLKREGIYTYLWRLQGLEQV